MKKYLIFTILFFAVGILLVAIISYANTSNLSNYYPSQSGNYTKVHLINQSGGPDANNCFCSQSATYPTGSKAGSCDTGDLGVTYTNPAGTIFSDVKTGYLEICKSDGSAATYPGACFNRYSTSSFTGCPPKYVAIPSNPSKTMVFSSATGSAAAYTWSCCFTGNGSAPSKAGCFSIYSNTSSTNPPYQPAACTDSAQGDPNAYDIGCDVIATTSGNTDKVYKRNCCFNDTAGTNAAGYVTNCGGSSSSSGGQASSSGANSSSSSSSGSSSGSSGGGSSGSHGASSSGAGSSSGSRGASSGG